MSENNSGAGSFIALLFVLFLGVIYQNSDQILNFVGGVFEVIIGIAVVAGTAFLIFSGVNIFTESKERKEAETKSWKYSVEERFKKIDKERSSRSDYLKSVDCHIQTHEKEIKALEAELVKLKTKFEPKKEVIRAEAEQKTTDAIKAYIGGNQ